MLHKENILFSFLPMGLISSIVLGCSIERGCSSYLIYDIDTEVLLSPLLDESYYRPGPHWALAERITVVSEQTLHKNPEMTSNKSEMSRAAFSFRILYPPTCCLHNTDTVSPELIMETKMKVLEHKCHSGRSPEQVCFLLLVTHWPNHHQICSNSDHSISPQ